jgi:N-acetylglucosaminyldiphosphoundecaprenol N-acetyl-beta-D-mannosaminyltransferase
VADEVATGEGRPMTAGGPGEGSATPASRPGGFWAATFCGMPFSAVDARAVLDYLEQRRPSDPFGYVVTPNVDHVVRNWRGDGALRAVYEEADLSLCDSRILGLVARLVGLRLPIVTGSDLTAILFEFIINPYERVTIVGGDAQVVARLERRYELRNVRHYNPPMGFIRDRDAVLQTAAFIERLSSRFVFLAVGSPQQEMLAHLIKGRGRATGTALCIGASLLFLTGDLQRAPVWMRRARLEWLHRLLSEPRRLWRRYLVEGPKIFRLAAEQMLAQGGRKERRVQVSIVIPTFRREHLLARLLERCVGQGGLGPQELEIIVVDNTPEATARPVVQPFIDGLPAAIRYAHEPRPGISHARNRGVAEAKGDFVAFIDDDELPAPNWLESLLLAQRTYRADVVLGPVRPVFDRPPRRRLEVLRRFFSQTSDAPTGTPVSLHTPLPLGSGGACRRPMASNNALLLKARCFDGAQPFDPRLGLTGGEDTLFFTELHRRGRRIVWCREALVTERVPRERLTLRFMLRRKFRDGQITSSTCLLLDPPQRGRLAAWVAVGLAQLGAGGLLALLYPVRPGLGLRGLLMAATGLGKVLFKTSFRRPSYGAGAAATPTGT